MYDFYDGRMAPTQGDQEEASPSSSSTLSQASDGESDGSEELRPDDSLPSRPEVKEPEKEKTFIAITLDIDESDFDWLSKNRHRRCGAIWLSKKMAKKGKEIDGKRLPLSEKKE